MDPIDVLKLVLSRLEDLNMPYMVGGSFASSFYGVDRSTRDADVVVAMSQDDVGRFVEAFQRDFYLDRGTIERALRAGASFNIIHLKSMFKVDFFVLKQDAFGQESFSRRRSEQLERGSDFHAHLQSPEDTILSKLIWYKLGGGVSENQWRDVTGILKAQGARLDLAYLRKWAPEVGVADLLERVLEEGGQTRGRV
jgi:hypothetical protein